jgi:hypothetical protein
MSAQSHWTLGTLYPVVMGQMKIELRPRREAIQQHTPLSQSRRSFELAANVNKPPLLGAQQGILLPASFFYNCLRL